MNRKQFLARRAGVTQRIEKEKAIAQRLLPFFKPGTKVGAYIPIHDEVNVFAQIQNQIQQLPGCRLLVPKVLSKTEMVFLPCTDLRPGTWGILEPAAGREAQEVPDIYVVPLTGFFGLHRMGYGAGYYDRYLAAHSGLKIGIAFDEQEGEFDWQPWDVQLDAIITPTRMVQSPKVRETGADLLESTSLSGAKQPEPGSGSSLEKDYPQTSIMQEREENCPPAQITQEQN